MSEKVCIGTNEAGVELLQYTKGKVVTDIQSKVVDGAELMMANITLKEPVDVMQSDLQKINQLCSNILDINKPECEGQLARHIVEAAYRTLYEIADGLSNIATIQKGTDQ